MSEYVQFYPLAAFVGLLLAGFNIPVSEDLVIITGALISQESVRTRVVSSGEMLIPSLMAIYAGVIASDCISYYLGTMIRKGTVKANFASAFLTQKNIEHIHRHLDKHGFLTFIIYRFIPFGARNTLFMSSGFLGVPFRRFALYDITAALISTNTLFFLVYHFGDEIRSPIRAAGIMLFVLPRLFLGSPHRSFAVSGFVLDVVVL